MIENNTGLLKKLFPGKPFKDIFKKYICQNSRDFNINDQKLFLANLIPTLNDPELPSNTNIKHPLNNSEY